MKVNEIFLYKVAKELKAGVSARALIKSTIRDFQMSFAGKHKDISETQLVSWTRKLEGWGDLSDTEILKKFETKIESCKRAQELKRIA